MFELKQLSRDAIPAALEKAKRYRLLNEPWQAESICRDVVAQEPGNQKALVMLLLSVTDQFKTEGAAQRLEDAREILGRLTGGYEKAYYAGIIEERRGTALLARRGTGSGPVIYGHLRRAMAHYEEAEPLRRSGDESARLRWNTCARIIMGHAEVQPEPAGRGESFLE
jgi:hypothetical protein